nr:MAG TPA: hypothetical protein [Caudoviricetes sp.]
MSRSKTTSTRLNVRLLLSAALLVLVVCCSSLVRASSSTGTLPQEQTIIVPLSAWNELKGNLKEADASIKSSNLSLNEAQSLTIKQGEELAALKIINEERARELAELRNINDQQGQELAKAESLVKEQASSLETVSGSLIELKQEIKNNKRTEQRLRRQRDTWAISNAALFLASALRR